MIHGTINIKCSESIQCFPSVASKCFLKSFVSIPVAPIITGIILHFMFHIRCISIHKRLYFSYFLLPFARHFCPRVLPRLSVCMFSPFFNNYSWNICCKFSVCVYCLIPQHCNIFLFIYWLGRTCVPSACRFNA